MTPPDLTPEQEAAIRADERERLSARVYENGWCPTCGRVSDEPSESNVGRSVSDLSRDELLGVAIRNLNECLDATARADRLERLVRAAAPFVNGVAVIANAEPDGDMTPALEWLADAAQTLGTLPAEEAR